MEVLVLRDAERFADLAGPWMAADPYSTNVIGARLAIACAGDQPRGEDDIWVTQAALDAGAVQVVLYADLANPTSNAIYQNIGYLPDHDAEERSFVQGTE
jgi:hypothetical protein